MLKNNHNFTESKFAIYHMQKNAYIGDCLCVVYNPSAKEILIDALQTPYILVFIKSKQNLSLINTVQDFKHYKIFSPDSPILLRISSECLFGVFGDSHCDCESQRISSLREIGAIGQGIYIHLPQEGQGNGLFYKTQELELQVSGINPEGKYVKEKNIKDASKYLLSKQPLDKRNYESLKFIFTELQLSKHKYDLISDNHIKANFLKNKLGLKLNSLYNTSRIINIENAGEYLAKLYMKDFEISDVELQNIYFVLFSAKELPSRVISLLKYIEEDISHKKKFRANNALLKKIISLCSVKQQRKQVQDLKMFKDTESYTEYQSEIVINRKELDLLFKKKLLTNDELLHYEENYFYDLVYFKGTPARSLKIRKSFRLTDRDHPQVIKLIYKIPISHKNYTIKSIFVPHEDIANLMELSLHDYEIHFLPVFTHNLSTSIPNTTILLKRYSKNLRTLSLMGNKRNVCNLIKNINKIFIVNEIDDPTNHRYIRKDLSLDFNWEKLSKEELSIFKKYHKG